MARILGCSVSKINYWLKAHNIKKRGISESLYLLKNSKGDPFKTPQKMPLNFFTGLAMGLFWGEGNKKSRHSVRIGNSDPKLILAFRHFLINTCKVDINKIKYGLQVFTDTNVNDAKSYWIKQLKIRDKDFYPTVVISQSGRKGTYKNKSETGVITMYFNNVKLKQMIDKYLEDVRKMY